jgi:hypothetical protein
MGSFCQDIVAVITRLHGPALAEVAARLSQLKIAGDVRRFMVARMGSTGSTWLAKLLNSHPDVYCSHEGFVSQLYPKNQCTGDDVLRFIEYFAWDTKHYAYEAVGDVGSIWVGHAAFLPGFTTGLLTRHPARILYTRLCTYGEDRSFSEIPPESAVTLRELWGIDLDRYDDMDCIFLHDALTFASQVWVLDKTNLVIRIEDLNDISYCQTTLHALTGLNYQEGLVMSATRKRINQRTGAPLPVSEIVARFTPRQRDWYNLLLADVAPRFGYSLLE